MYLLGLYFVWTLGESVVGKVQICRIASGQLCPG